VGAGSTFLVRLPLQPAAQAIGVQDALVEEKILTASFPVLIVEDNLINRKVAGAIVRSFGLEFEFACSGLEALERYALREYSAILMDCHMPEMDGLEATRRIRGMNRSWIPIIALTAGTGESDRQLAKDAGMDDFLSKPLRRQELGNALQKWIARDLGVDEASEIALSMAVSTSIPDKQA
jgi:two-component system, sensor histidine kinase